MLTSLYFNIHKRACTFVHLVWNRHHNLVSVYDTETASQYTLSLWANQNLQSGSLANQGRGGTWGGRKKKNLRDATRGNGERKGDVLKTWGLKLTHQVLKCSQWILIQKHCTLNLFLITGDSNYNFRLLISPSMLLTLSYNCLFPCWLHCLYHTVSTVIFLPVYVAGLLDVWLCNITRK